VEAVAKAATGATLAAVKGARKLVAVKRPKPKKAAKKKIAPKKAKKAAKKKAVMKKSKKKASRKKRI
jgi:hypothetical protein